MTMLMSSKESRIFILEYRKGLWPHLLHRIPAATLPCPRSSVVSACASPSSSFKSISQRHLRVPKPGVHSSGDDILELNVGGRVMLTTRSTMLQIKRSRLHDMFKRSCSARLPRDSQGRVFLDYDSYCFGCVLKFLRNYKLNGGDIVRAMPPVRKDELVHFINLMLHFKLFKPVELPAALAALDPSFPTPPQSNKLLSSAIPQTEPATNPNRLSSHSPNSSQHSTSYTSSSQYGLVKPLPDDHTASESKFHRLTSKSGELQGSYKGHDGFSQLITSADSCHLSPLPMMTSASPSCPVPSATHPPASSTYCPSDFPPVHVSSLPPTTSQLFYVQASYESTHGIKMSVYAEQDLEQNSSISGPFDLFCDATYSEAKMSLTFVARKDFENLFVGLTSAGQTDCRGSQIPCFGWKQRGSGRAVSQEKAAAFSTSAVMQQPRAVGPCSETVTVPMWRKGDSVEMILTPSSQGSSTLALKVNGQFVDRIEELPPLHLCCWYMGIFTAADMSCVVFQRDSYSVCWGDYHVKRYL